MMPKMDGFTLAEEIKSIQPAIPLIFLTAKTLRTDILKGYKIGADDYITKPFDSEVLLCKIRAILNRKSDRIQNGRPLKIGQYIYDPQQRVLELNKSRRCLSPKEGQLLQLLAESRNSVLVRERALNLVWGQADYFTSRSMDVYITRLRKYLKDDPEVTIENIHGKGYILKV
jgi:DNA-binding response OmpR family regulator